jgi:ferredoxin-thioredoxin reductase catalytic subunit
MATDKQIEKLIAEYQEYAKKEGFKLNPNEAVVRGVVKRMLDIEEKNGERYCPCRRQTGNAEEDKQIICPCTHHKDEVEKDGHCHCFLFVKG